MTQTEFDLIVIGSGSAASAGWSTARAMGKSVAVFEAGVLGGECPTFACVPTKALLHAASVFNTVQEAPAYGIDTRGVSLDYERVKAWKDETVSRTGAAQGEEPYREAGVTLIRAEARFVAPDRVQAGSETYGAEKFLIATGSSAVIPPIDGLSEAGFLTSWQAIDLTVRPDSLLVLGGGPVGCEFTHLFKSFGAEVTLVESGDGLISHEDPEVGHFLEHAFDERGVKVLTNTDMTRISARDGQKVVAVERDGEPLEIPVQEILVAVGQKANTDIGLEEAGIEVADGSVVVDKTLVTSNPSVYAAGDVVGPYNFTHAASYQGSLAIRNAFSDDKREADYSAMPRCVFTAPEVAAIGKTEAEAREGGGRVKIGRADVGSLGRANTANVQEGFVKVVTDGDGRLLGGVIVSPRAGEMLHELAIALSVGATAEQIGETIHAFPTYSEAVGNACSNLGSE